MATAQPENEGENDLIQDFEVTSSSDCYYFPLRPSKSFPQCRSSYRRRFLGKIRSSFTYPNPRIMQNPSVSFTSCRPKLGLQDIVTTRFATITVLFIFVCSLTSLAIVYGSFPNVTEEEKTHIKIPWNIEDAKQLGIVLDRYKDDNYYQVLGGVFITYVFLQTFAIPGSLFLSILSGFLFPFTTALLLVCACSALGATLCFLLSQLLGRRLVLHYFPARAHSWSLLVDKHRSHLLNYVIFLRVTPFLPNWFINLTAPVIGVPLVPFALGTFLGVAPPSFVAIQAGKTLHTMSAEAGAFSWASVGLLGVFAVVSLVPVFLKQRLKEKFE